MDSRTLLVKLLSSEYHRTDLMRCQLWCGEWLGVDRQQAKTWANDYPGLCHHMASLGHNAWWRHQMETFSALLAICAGNSPVPGDFPTQRPVTRSFDVFFNLCLNKRLRKQSWRWWFETLSRPLWRHCNGVQVNVPQDRTLWSSINQILYNKCIAYLFMVYFNYLGNVGYETEGPWIVNIDSFAIFQQMTSS